MADITSSLFPEAGGLFNQQYLQSQAAGQNAAALASGGPMQAALATGLQGAGQSGYMLGSSIGRALGGTTPEEDQAKAVKAIAAELVAEGKNPQTSEGMSIMVQRLNSKGLFQAAQKAQVAATTLREKEATIGLRQAQTALAGAKTTAAGTAKTASSTEAERLRALVSEKEVKLANGEALTPKEEAELRFAIGQVSKPKYITDPESGQTTVLPATMDINTAAPNVAKFLGKGASGIVAPPITGAPETVPVPVAVPTTTVPAGATQIQTGKGRGLGEGVIKELAATDQQISNVQASLNNIDTVAPYLDKVVFGPVVNFTRAAYATVGKDSPDRVAFDALKRVMAKESNSLLQVAKGTQTKDDAERIDRIISDPNTWRSQAAIKAAYADLRKTQEDTLKAIGIKRNTLASKGTSAAPTALAGGNTSSKNETIIQKVMAANPNLSRTQVEAELKKRGYL